VIDFLGEYPWLLPGIVAALVVGVALSGRAAGWLGTTRPVAAVMLVTLLVILAATLAPPGLSPAVETVAQGTCDLSRIGLPSPAQLFARDVAGNVLAFIPLGFAIGMIPRSRRKALVLAGAVALPFLIEAVQLVATPLGRLCQSGDVVDNLTGLVIGLVVAAVYQRLRRGGSRA
jgi:glycopeptide antibiotics resistance protein